MRCEPSTRSDLITCTTGGGVGAAGAGAAAGAWAGAVCASADTGTPASIVPPSNRAVARAPNVETLIVTMPPQSEKSHGRDSPAPTTSTDQPAQTRPHAVRTEIVECHKQHQRE